MAKKRTTRKTTKKQGSADTQASGRGYTVLARRYRSRDFGEVIGQEPIARTLQTAIETGRAAHAYLFCGTRGVGKTSMARIFAKALNRHDGLTEADAIDDAVMRGEDLDVIEIDGASNRGINEARDLIASAGLSPARSRYRIYIIDEVHMLTREAFNALLKTMEEPPSHVKFILCTTDPHKVPATIQSRCQRFDFRAIPTRKIAEHLTAILEQEGVEAESDLVLTVAGLGAGSMRDALSLLDRLLASGMSPLTLEGARDTLGLPDEELLDSIVQAVIDETPAAALASGAELIAAGATVETALEMLTEHFRGLMLLVTCGADTELVDLTESARERMSKQAAHFDPAGLVYMIATCDAIARSARGSATARALFDAALVRLSLGAKIGDVTRLLAGAEKKNDVTSTARSDAPRAKALTPARTASTPKSPRSAPSRFVPPSAPESTPPSKPASKPVAKPAAKPVSTPETNSSPAPAPAAKLSPPAVTTMLDRYAEETPAASARLAHFSVKGVDGRTVVFDISNPGGKSIAFLSAQSKALEEDLRRATGQNLAARIQPQPSAPAERPAETTQSGAARTEELTEAADMPLVREAVSIFDAVVTDVRRLSSDHQE